MGRPDSARKHSQKGKHPHSIYGLISSTAEAHGVSNAIIPRVYELSSKYRPTRRARRAFMVSSPGPSTSMTIKRSGPPSTWLRSFRFPSPPRRYYSWRDLPAWSGGASGADAPDASGCGGKEGAGSTSQNANAAKNLSPSPRLLTCTHRRELVQITHTATYNYFTASCEAVRRCPAYLRLRNRGRQAPIASSTIVAGLPRRSQFPIHSSAHTPSDQAGKSHE